MSDNSGVSAFPVLGDASDIPSITLRDYFAAQVMNGLLCQNNNVSAPLSLLHEMLAVRAYQIADEMMKARTHEQ